MAVVAVGEQWREGGRGQERASGLVCAEIMIYSEEVLLISCKRREEEKQLPSSCERHSATDE